MSRSRYQSSKGITGHALNMVEGKTLALNCACWAEETRSRVGVWEKIKWTLCAYSRCNLRHGQHASCSGMRNYGASAGSSRIRELRWSLLGGNNADPVSGASTINVRGKHANISRTSPYKYTVVRGCPDSISIEKIGCTDGRNINATYQSVTCMSGEKSGEINDGFSFHFEYGDDPKRRRNTIGQRRPLGS